MLLSHFFYFRLCELLRDSFRVFFLNIRFFLVGFGLEILLVSLKTGWLRLVSGEIRSCLNGLSIVDLLVVEKFFRNESPTFVGDSTLACGF